MSLSKINVKNIIFLTLFAIFFFLVGITSENKLSLEKMFFKTPTVQVSEEIKKNQENLDLSYFWEAYSLIKDNYLTFDTITNKEINEGMTKGVIESLKDKHSEYFNQEETKKFNEVLSGDFEGIGAVVKKNDLGVMVEQIVAGSPAKEAGLLVGDVLITANKEPLKGLDLPDAVGKIKGQAGTHVVLEVLRSGEEKAFTKDIIRKKITVPSVDGKVLDNKMGYIQISIFGEKTAEEFQNIYKNLLTQNIQGVIIDLRDNSGGYLNTAIAILSEFFDKNTPLVSTKEKNPFNNQTYFSFGNANKQLPVVVLVNENSASASEITAGTFQDYKKGILVGTKTFGKGSVQQPFTLSDGAEMKVTVARWFTPNGNQIDEKGIKPDVVVDFTKEDYVNKFDRQLDTAKKVLSTYIETKDYNKAIKNNIATENRNIQTASGSTSSGTLK